MLQGLVIRDIVLVDSLALDFAAGLTALTGETGTGKSILLDALSLALGARASSGLVRHGAARGSVSASFALPPGHAALALLAEQGIETDAETLILRRSVDASGSSRAFVNDQPVSVGLLRRLGDLLVEIHGQHDDRGLLDPASHRDLLDAYGGLADDRAAVAGCHADLEAAEAALHAAEAAVAEAAADESYLRHALEEIEALAPEPGEEERLAAERTRLMQGERLAGSLAEIRDSLGADGGVDAQLRAAIRRLERLDGDARNLLAPVLTAFDKAAIEAAEGLAALDRLLIDLEHDPERAEAVEERLFALRALA
ncbi:MAG: DNA repair protein RecN, partial [Alphaproteobacteria bacterium]